MTVEKQKTIGVVIIGRNEGERLKRCIRSLDSEKQALVYVDSDSSDDSVAWVAEQGIHVVELDTSIPFTAGRARNEGFFFLVKAHPDLEYVQFVDGDCEIQADWLNQAQLFLDQQADMAVVCGRRRERYPQASIYNALCDLEWNSEVGEATACGGDSLMRVSAFVEVNGFNPEVIAGEEPELCLRLRREGWSIWRLDEEMTIHDAAMTELRQWSKRMRRAGYAYALGASLHGRGPERYRVRETMRILFWGAVLPFLAVFGMLVWSDSLLLLLAYPLQFLRLYVSKSSHVDPKYRLAWSFFLTLGKFPELLGVLELFFAKLSSRQAKIIEYK